MVRDSVIVRGTVKGSVIHSPVKCEFGKILIWNTNFEILKLLKFN